MKCFKSLVRVKNKMNSKFCCYNRVNDLLGTNFESNKDIDWKIISKDYKLSEDFMREFKNKLDWYNLSIYQSFSESFIEEFKRRVNWDFISIHQKLSEEFILKYKKKLNLKLVSGSQVLSEDFIKKFKYQVDWERISAYQSLSEKFIEGHKYLVSWTNISRHQLLSTEFIIKFAEFVNLYNISRSQPFLDLNNSRLESMIDKELLGMNTFYDLYQKTKDRGWFVGYVVNESNHFSIINPSALVSYNIKAMIYWKDVDLIYRVREYKPIRLVKII